MYFVGSVRILACRKGAYERFHGRTVANAMELFSVLSTECELRFLMYVYVVDWIAQSV